MKPPAPLLALHESYVELLLAIPVRGPRCTGHRQADARAAAWRIFLREARAMRYTEAQAKCHWDTVLAEVAYRTQQARSEVKP